MMVASTTERITDAVTAVIAGYSADLDADRHLRAVRIEVRVKPDGAIRAVILHRESEFAEKN